MKPFSLVIISLIFILLLSLPCYGEDITIRIPRGSHSSDIAQLLKDNHIIPSVWWFRLLVHFQSKPPYFYSGAFRLTMPATTQDLINQLQDRSRKVIIKLTIPEGYNLKQIDDQLTKLGLIQANDFYNFSTNTENIKGYIDRLHFDPDLNFPENLPSLEGLIFPDTYFFDGDATLPEIVGKLRHNFELKVFPLWQDYLNQVNKPEPAPPVYGKHKHRHKAPPPPPKHVLSFMQWLTMASLVESEAAVNDERPIIASVYLNRLKAGMALGACPTVHYSRLLQGLERKTELSFDDLKIESPYNTYKHSGLPPGPICNSGALSLEAVNGPAQTRFFYFVAKGEGRHHFSTTAKEHEEWSRKRLLKLAQP